MASRWDACCMFMFSFGEGLVRVGGGGDVRLGSPPPLKQFFKHNSRRHH